MSSDPDLDRYHAYMSGRMSGLGEESESDLIERIYDPISELTNSLGIECYFPHESRTATDRATDFEYRIWEIDHQLINNCDFMLAYMGIPSFGVGAELEMARVAEVPTIMFCEKDQQEQVSRLSIGNSTTEPLITFSSQTEMKNKLASKMTEIMHDIRTRKVAFEEQWSETKADQVVNHLNEQSSIQRDAIAQRGEDGAWDDTGLFTREQIRNIGEELSVDESVQDTLF